MTLHAVLITKIENVLFVKKDNPKGKIDNYSRPGGLHTYELIYRLEGEVETAFDKTILNNKKDTLQFLPKQQGDACYRVKTKEPGCCIDVFFDTNAPLSETAFCIDAPHTTEMRECFQKMHNIWLKKEPGYEYEAFSVFYKILSLLTSEQNNPHALKIQPAVDFLNEHFCDSDIDFFRVSALCNMSYSYFRRLFLKAFGISPGKYVAQKRIDYAKDLLHSNRFNASEVADMVGFKDVYYFSHAFKNATGVSPTQYR